MGFMAGGGLSLVSRRTRVLALPLASSKTFSLILTFSFGIAALAASRRSARWPDLRMYFFSSGVERSSSENCRRADGRGPVSASTCPACFAAFFILRRSRTWLARSSTFSALPVAPAGVKSCSASRSEILISSPVV